MLKRFATVSSIVILLALGYIFYQTFNDIRRYMLIRSM
jgi:hypothetical protein